MQTPFITVITSTLNCIDVIPNLFKSLESQICQDFEWLIVDGGSNDGTIDYLKKNTKAIVIYSGPDKGIYDAWNRAISKISGKWTIFLGADDYLHNEYVISNFVKFASNTTEKYQILYGRVITDDFISSTHGKKLKNIKRNMRLNMAICHQATFHNKNLFKKCGNFDDKYKIAGDYEYLLRCIFKFDALSKYIPFVISVMGTKGISTNRSNGLRSAIEAFQARVDNDIFPLNLFWLRHLIAGIFYYLISKIRKLILSKISTHNF